MYDKHYNAKLDEIELGHGVKFQIGDGDPSKDLVGLSARQGAFAPSKRFVSRRQVSLMMCLAFQVFLVYVSIVHYDALFLVSPVGAAIYSSSTMAGLSQGLIQVAVRKQLSFPHLTKFYIWGLISGLYTKCWTDQLNEMLTSTGVKVACDQLIGNPTSIFLFFVFVSYWDKLDFYAQMTDKFLSTLKTSLLIWPLASFAMFYFIPPYMSVPFNSCISLLWTVILGLQM